MIIKWKFRLPVTVVGIRARMDGSERFWVGEYNGGGGLPEKVVFWSKFGDKGCSFALALIPMIGSSIGSGEWCGGDG